MKMCVFLFIWLFFVVTNLQIWVYGGMTVFFCLKLKSLSDVGPKHTTIIDLSSIIPVFTKIALTQPNLLLPLTLTEIIPVNIYLFKFLCFIAYCYCLVCIVYKFHYELLLILKIRDKKMAFKFETYIEYQ